MRIRILIFFLIIASKSLACECVENDPTLEFLSSEYVFEGTVVSKKYAIDSLTFEVTFNITKHYKKGNSPKNLSFIFNSEGEYTGIFTSCDWTINEDQKWLVYARYYNGELVFSGMCSNSQRIDLWQLSDAKKRVLNNANEFEIKDFIYDYQDEFNYCKNITDIETVLEKGKIKDYSKNVTLFYLLIDEEGNLKEIIRSHDLIRENDSTFGFLSNVSSKNDQIISEFERDAMELIKKVNKWEIKRFKSTDIKVRYLRHIWLTYDPISKKWDYDL